MKQSALEVLSPFSDVFRQRKRQRTAALQDLRSFMPFNSSRGVLECGSPLPLFRLAVCLLGLIASSVADSDNKSERGFGPEAAREDAKKLVAADGLDATLFASEPLLVNPCDMEIDSRGRVWITEGANYRKWSNPP